MGGWVGQSIHSPQPDDHHSSSSPVQAAHLLNISCSYALLCVSPGFSVTLNWSSFGPGSPPTCLRSPLPRPPSYSALSSAITLSTSYLPCLLIHSSNILIPLLLYNKTLLIFSSLYCLNSSWNTCTLITNKLRVAFPAMVNNWGTMFLDCAWGNKWSLT